MNIFNRKIKKKNIEQFEYKIAELLNFELPQIKIAMEISKLFDIGFTHNPDAIYVLRSFNEEDFEEINRNHKARFNLIGISVWNRKNKKYQPIKLNFLNNNLTNIHIDNPEFFHKTFDLNRLQKSEIKLEHLKIENPDRKMVEEALKTLTREQLELLELDYTFEIELNEKSYYTILDMEEGNYVAVDKNSKIYFLGHNHKEVAKLISNNPIDFFKNFSGDKNNLEKMMTE